MISSFESYRLFIQHCDLGGPLKLIAVYIIIHLSILDFADSKVLCFAIYTGFIETAEADNLEPCKALTMTHWTLSFKSNEM